MARVQEQLPLTPATSTLSDVIGVKNNAVAVRHQHQCLLTHRVCKAKELEARHHAIQALVTQTLIVET